MVQARLKLGLRGGIWCWGRWGRWATMGLAGMAGLAGLVSVARVSSLHAADDDYAFVVKLLSPEFEMDQMAATQIQQMGQVQTPEGQFDYKLAQAYQDIAQAESGDVAPGPSSDLMSAAKKLLEDLSTDAKAKGYRNYDAAVKLQGTIKTKTIDMMISDAKMIEDDDPKKAEQLREQAAAAYDDLFQAEKTVMVDADKQWFPNITKMGEFFKKHENDEGDVKLPPDIAQGVMEAWMHIMPPCNEWANYGLLAMKYYSATNPRRALIRTDICTYFTEKANNEYADNELVTMTFFEFMGEACGYMDDLKAMNDNLDNVWQVNPNEYPNPAAKQLVLEIKKRAAFFMVDLNMQKKNYQEVIDRINRILFDAPTMWETDMGKQLIFDLAKAECLLPNGPDYEDAKDQIVNLMGKMAETDPWMNNARRALSEVVDLAQQHGVMLSMPGQRWYDAGRGLFQLASVDEQQAEAFTKDNKADRAAKLNEQARPLFFTAIKFYRNAISAERQGEAPLTERMAVEGNAWNEMAFAYLKLKLQYESMLAFKGLVETFRDESLKALVKVSRNPEDQTLLTRPTDEQKKSLTDIDAKLKEARKDMVAIASTIYGETPTNYNREIKAEIIKYVEGGSENDFGNTTHEFQLAQLAYDAATGDKSNGMAYRGAGGEDNLKRSQEQFEESYANFVKAAGMFAQIPTSNASYESSLYMSAASYYQAYLLYAQDTLKVDADARKA